MQGSIGNGAKRNLIYYNGTEGEGGVLLSNKEKKKDYSIQLVLGQWHRHAAKSLFSVAPSCT